MIGGSIFGKRSFEDAQFGQGTGHPEGQAARGLDLHEHLVGRKDGNAPGVRVQGKSLLAVADFSIKGDPERLVLHPAVGVPLIGEEDGRA